MVRSKSILLRTINRKSKKKIDYLSNKEVKISDISYPLYIKNYFTNCLQNLIDPNQRVYSHNSLNDIEQEFNMGIKVTAISPDAEDYDLIKKNLEYDPYLEDFVIGAKGRLGTFDLDVKSSSTLVIRGLGGSSQKAIKHCIEHSLDFYAIDTGYIQPGTKKEYHRITKNNLQNIGPIVERDTDRLKKLNWQWRSHKPGKTILVVPPSEKVMKFYGQNLTDWTNNTISEIKKYTDKPVVIRLKPARNERVTTNTIWQAMDDAYCVITYNSIAATEALLYGVPAIALAPNSARMLCNTEVNQINDLYIPTREDVTKFAAHLSYCQFTALEMRNGRAWSVLNESS